MTYTEVMAGAGILAGLFSFIFNYGHLLSSLVSLELMGLMVYYFLCLMMSSTSGDFFFVLFYLVFAVCEGALGLSLLVSSAHSHGSDFMKTYNSLTC
nr:TPA_asm: ND4L [Baikalogammarus pullus]